MYPCLSAVVVIRFVYAPKSFAVESYTRKVCNVDKRHLITVSVIYVMYLMEHSYHLSIRLY